MRARGRTVEGVLILDKPLGCSSHAALQRVKKLYDARKVGHTGSLDPMASGVLPLFFGQVTRLCDFLLHADKGYECTAVFGTNSLTGDSEGERLYCCDTSDLCASDIQAALPDLSDSILQYAPSFSAVKVGGQRLYRAARLGIHLERPVRRVRIEKAELCQFIAGKAARATFRIVCSKGTYIRSWVADLGRILGCGAYVENLRRTQAGYYSLDHAVNIDTLEQAKLSDPIDYTKLDALLLLPQSPVEHLPEVFVSPSDAHRLRCGQSLGGVEMPGPLVRVISESGEFVGIGERSRVHSLSPKIMFDVGA